MISDVGVEAVGDEQEWAATRAWVESRLAAGECVVAAERLRGGWTSEMRRRTRAMAFRASVADFQSVSRKLHD